MKPATTFIVVRRFSVPGAGALRRSGLCKHLRVSRQQSAELLQPWASAVDATSLNVRPTG